MKDLFRVAVIVDIHGNYKALQAVLDDALGFAPDCYVFGGDIVSGAAQTRQCMGEMKRLNSKVLHMTLKGIVGETKSVRSTEPPNSPVDLWSIQPKK